ncbi:hypothetical protein [Sporosarcina psychrophila]|uniref:hypothetical protein n=1 Tax=Sporosarcina psychrophila TaxID=1476 RepID=UPI00078CB6C2|nr:hypothetical protein [Sporosarcina psychrophila]AMQ05896.1 hypothetical protein AZE41_08185 [Sporosarcina psychrophila]
MTTATTTMEMTKLIEEFCKNPNEPTQEEIQALLNFLNDVYTPKSAVYYMNVFIEFYSSKSKVNDNVMNMALAFMKDLQSQLMEQQYPSWEMQWEKAYKETLDYVLKNKNGRFSAEDIVSHISMLNYVEENINDILSELEEVHRVLHSGMENIMFFGFRELLKSDYEQDEHGFVAKVNEHIEIRFMPFVLDEMMMAEYNVEFNGAHLSLKIYENDEEWLNIVLE